MHDVSCLASAIVYAEPAKSRPVRQGRPSLYVLAAITIFCSARDCAAATPAPAPPAASVETTLLLPRFAAPQLTAQPIAGTCGPADVILASEPGGLTQISVGSSCRAGELVSISYADATFVDRLDSEGHSKTVLDCFAGDTVPITIAFEDGTSVTRQPVTDDLARYSKVAIVWSSSVDLDLHAFEYAAGQNDAGHIWSGRPLSFAEAEASARNEKRGHGFLSSASTGTSIGMNVEVYTFVHYPHEKSAGVKMGVDFTTRGGRAEGEYCGSGPYSEIHFKAYTLEKGRTARRLDLAFAGVPCGTEISNAVRVNSRLIPELTIRE